MLPVLASNSGGLAGRGFALRRATFGATPNVIVAKPSWFEPVAAIHLAR